MIVARRRPEDFSPTVQRLLAVGTAWHMEQHGDEFGAFLEWLLSDQRGYDLDIVEIGTRRGGTAAVWCALAHSVVGVDLPSEAENLSQLTRAFPARFRYVAGDSHDPRTFNLVRRIPAKIDLLFLDGDHAAAGVQQDFDMYSPLVRSGGLVVFHDIVDTAHVRQFGHGVAEVWAALPGEKTEFLLGDGLWGGLGVWRKP